MGNRMLSSLERIVFVVALVGLSGCRGVGPKFAVVASPTFILEDENNNRRGLVFAREDGSGIVLKDGSGRERVRLFARDEEAGIVLLDKSGNFRVLIATSDVVGASFVALVDDKGEIASKMLVRRDDSSDQVSQDKIEEDAKRLLEKLRSGWLEGLTELDKQVP